MAILTQRPKGTQDVTPREVRKWQTVEKVAAQTAETFGFKEIRFPTFEHTELFTRSVGETTDVVQKEMYTFIDKGDRSITLRPEGTASTMRALLENGLLNDALPLKVFYITPCFRYEKPQAGRLREFHQFGVEMAGAQSPVADAEVISLARTVLTNVGIKKLKLFINSIGCPACRAKYHEALKEFFAGRKDELCETCLSRLEKNPMRILDCKSPICSDIANGAPVILDFLCEECSDHFEKLKGYLTAMNIEFEVNPKIVRGLDYYTKTVFEFVTEEIGAQGTVCGGGRFDGLIEELGGKPTPCLGFAIGLERLIMLAEKQGAEFMEDKALDLYVAPLDDNTITKALWLTASLREMGFRAETDSVGRGLKAQMKYADKMGARYTIVLGSDEIANNKAKLKNMQTGEQLEISLGDDFAEKFLAVSFSEEIEF